MQYLDLEVTIQQIVYQGFCICLNGQRKLLFLKMFIPFISIILPHYFNTSPESLQMILDGDADEVNRCGFNPIFDLQIDGFVSSFRRQGHKHPIIKIEYDRVQQLLLFQMSFFERMMKINQSKNTSIRLDSHYAMEGQQPSEEKEQKEQDMIQDHTGNGNSFSRKNSRRCMKEDDESFDVPDEGKVSKIYPSVKANLLTKLLPKKQQLLREMLARKRQFQQKKLGNSIVNKGMELKMRLQESCVRFTNSIQVHQEPQVKNFVKLRQSNASRKQITTKEQQGFRNSSQKTLKDSLAQLREDSQSKKNIHTTHNNNSQSQPQNQQVDSFGREIMLKLFNLLQNQRCDRKDFMTMSMSLNSHKANIPQMPHQREKDTPIIINNIMKTPIDALNRDLIERQMKIKMMQNNRMKQKTSLRYSRNAEDFSNHLEENLLTQRSETAKCKEFISASIALKTDKKRQKNKARISLQSSQISNKNKAINDTTSKRQEQVQQQTYDKEQTTKPNSNFNSQIQFLQEPKPLKSKGRDFSKQRINAKVAQQSAGKDFDKVSNPKQKDKSQSKQKSQNKDGENIFVQQKIAHKASVRLEIMLDDSCQTQGMSLAQAFKRKKGKLKSEKDKDAQNKLKQKQKQMSIMKPHPSSEYMLTQTYTQFKFSNPSAPNILPLQSCQNINISKQTIKKQSKAKRINHSKLSNRQNKECEDNSSSKKSKEPSKDLIDRLIGGQRAKISKKDMFALTKKNYENLPQVQAKKRQQQKLKIQKQRLAKIKQLQKSSRNIKQIKVSLQ